MHSSGSGRLPDSLLPLDDVTQVPSNQYPPFQRPQQRAHAQVARLINTNWTKTCRKPDTAFPPEPCRAGSQRSPRVHAETRIRPCGETPSDWRGEDRRGERTRTRTPPPSCVPGRHARRCEPTSPSLPSPPPGGPRQVAIVGSSFVPDKKIR